MATVADYLSTGPEALESDLVKNVFPGETPDAPKRNILDFQREEADVNTMFDGPNKINYNIIKEAVDANKALNLANTANQILPNQQELTAKIDLFKDNYERSVPTSEKL